MGLIVTNAQLDVANHTAYVTLQNSSGKDITGYSLSVDIKYLSGYTGHLRHDEDLGPDATPIMAGTSTDLTLYLDQKEDDSISSVNIAPVFVAFKDHTAKTRTKEGDDAMNDVVSQRNAIAVGFQESADMTADYLSKNGGDAHPAAKISKLMKENMYSQRLLQLKNAAALGGDHAAETSRQFMADTTKELDSLSNTANETDSVKRLLAEKRQHAESFRQYANLRRAQ